MLRKHRIGLFVLLLATGFMSVGEASARRGAQEEAAGPKQWACNELGCPDVRLGVAVVDVKIFCYEPARK